MYSRTPSARSSHKRLLFRLLDGAADDTLRYHLGHVARRGEILFDQHDERRDSEKAPPERVAALEAQHAEMRQRNGERERRRQPDHVQQPQFHTPG